VSFHQKYPTIIQNSKSNLEGLPVVNYPSTYFQMPVIMGICRQIMLKKSGFEKLDFFEYFKITIYIMRQDYEKKVE
jgi:hypothetical protein